MGLRVTQVTVEITLIILMVNPIYLFTSLKNRMNDFNSNVPSSLHQNQAIIQLLFFLTEIIYILYINIYLLIILN